MLKERMAEDAIEAIVRERQEIAVGGLERDIAYGVGRGNVGRSYDLRRAEINADNATGIDACCDAQRDGSGTTSAIQHRYAGGEVGGKEIPMRVERSFRHEIDGIRRISRRVRLRFHL